MFDIITTVPMLTIIVDKLIYCINVPVNQDKPETLDIFVKVFKCLTFSSYNHHLHCIWCIIATIVGLPNSCFAYELN